MELGKGSYGSVRGVGNEAIKTFKDGYTPGLNCLVTEAFVTRFVSLEGLPNVVRLRSCNFEKLTMTTERWHCNLDMAINRGMTLEQKRCVHRCILRGLAYIGRVYIINADIKPSNVLVNAKYTDACIADFGISSSSGAARVKLTSPAYSLPRPRVKNHRTHDTYSFVVLTLYMMYNYRFTSALVQSCSELQAVVRSLVPSGPMRTTLINLSQENRRESWTAERALYELYGETIPKLERCFIFSELKNAVLLEAIAKNVNRLNARFDFRRATRCSHCSSLIAVVLSIESIQDCITYSTVMSYIFSCVFGIRDRPVRAGRMSPRDVLSLGISNERLFSCMNTIIHNRDLVRLMFAP